MNAQPAGERVSDEFDRAFTTGGTDGPALCLCGRTHISTRCEDEDVARYVALAAERPDRYLIHDDCGIGVYSSGAVWGCPCNWDVRLEAFLWDARDQIVQFITERTRREAADAHAAAAKLDAALAGLSTKPSHTPDSPAGAGVRPTGDQ